MSKSNSVGIRWARSFGAALTALIITSSGFGQGTVEALKQRLASRDFRVRVQAALDLGEHRGKPAAREALARALNDASASVRASAVAALQAHGDKGSLALVQRMEADPSDVVRRQAARAVAALSQSSNGPAFVVELGNVRVGRRVPAQALDGHVRRVANKNLGRLPSVVMKADAKPEAEALPNLLLDGSLLTLNERREGKSFAVSAKVEFVISRMPGRVIKGRISGGATVHGDALAATEREELGRLRREAVEAATESALSNAERALEAAAQ